MKKKIYSALLAGVMLISSFASLITISAASASAVSNVRISGSPTAYSVLTGKYDYTGDTSDLTFTWLKSSTETGTYVTVANNYNTDFIDGNKLQLIDPDVVFDNSYKTHEFTIYPDSASSAVKITVPVPPQGTNDGKNTDVVGYERKWLKFRVTDKDGNNYDSDPIYIEPSWTLKVDDTAFDSYQKTTPEEYIFSVGGKNFILLDTFENDDDGHFLVFSKEAYGTRKYHLTSGQNQRPYEMMYWLNNSFKTSGGSDGSKLPDEIIAGINNERWWRVEVGTNWWNYGNYVDSTQSVWGNYRHSNISAQGGITLLSQTELVKYIDKIGLNDTRGWWLRSPDKTSAANILSVSTNGTGTTARDSDTTDLWIRPLFTLKKDFFLNNVVRLAEVGSDVRRTIIEDYTREELSNAGYSEAELKQYYDARYTVENMSFDGSAQVYKDLTFNYTYSGVAGEEALQWYMSDSADTGYAEIAGATNAKISLTDEQEEKYLKVKITAPNGQVFWSEPIFAESVYDDSFVGSLSSVSIEGYLEYDQQWNPVWTSDDGVTEADIAKYEWLVSAEPEGTYERFATGKKGYPSVAQNGKYVKVRVIVKNRSYLESEPVLVTGSQLNNKAVPIGGTNVRLDVVNKTTPKEHIFSVDGQEFILLDTTPHDVSKYFVLSKNPIGNKVMYYGDNRARHTSASALMGWLSNFDTVDLIKGTLGNTTYYESFDVGFGTDGYKGNAKFKQLPQGIFDHINYDMYWKNERGTYYHAENPSFYGLSIRGGLAPLSVAELTRYCAKIGLQDVERDWWLRTPYDNTTNGNNMTAVSGNPDTLGQTISMNACYEMLDVRPAFYLDSDFFKDVKIDYAGSEAMKIILENNTEAELKALYTADEFNSVFGMQGVIAKVTDLAKGNPSFDVTLKGIDRSAKVYCAVYDNTGRLVGIEIAANTLNSDGTVSATAQITGPDAGEYTAKAFVWTDEMAPLSDKTGLISVDNEVAEDYSKVFLAGDSIVCNYGATAYAGWGEHLPEIFDRTKIVTVNKAKGGATAKSFMDLGLLDEIEAAFDKEKDYFLVQFGHNEHNGGVSTDTYKMYLAQYIDAVGAERIVFVTPPAKRYFTSTGVFNDVLNVYATAMKELAAEYNVPVVELNALTTEWITELGEAGSESYYRPDDPQHFTHPGAKLCVNFIKDELLRINHPLAAYIK